MRGWCAMIVLKPLSTASSTVSSEQSRAVSTPVTVSSISPTRSPVLSQSSLSLNGAISSSSFKSSLIFIFQHLFQEFDFGLYFLFLIRIFSAVNIIEDALLVLIFPFDLFQKHCFPVLKVQRTEVKFLSAQFSSVFIMVAYNDLIKMF